MDIKLFQSSSQVLAKISGRLVLDECDRFKSALSPSNFPGLTFLCLDLSAVDFIDSAGLGALVGVKVSSSKAKAKMAVVNPSKNVSDILTVSKLDSIFEIHTGSDAEALVNSIATTANQLSDEVADAPSPEPVLNAPSIPRVATPAPPLANPKERIDQLCRDAVEFMRKTDYENAIACYKEAISINPDYMPAHNNLAIVYEKKPQWAPMAIEQWKIVLEMSTRNNDQKHIDRANKHLATLQRSAS